jgi:hypothetical protein
MEEIFYDAFKNGLNGDRITGYKPESYEGKIFGLFRMSRFLLMEI